MRCMSSLPLALSSIETIIPSYLSPIQVSAATTETAASDPSEQDILFLLPLLDRFF